VPSGNSQLPPAKRRSSVLAGERDSSQGGSSIASAIQGQNSTPSPSLNNSRIADITQRVTPTLYATQRWSLHTPTATPGTTSHSTPAPGWTSLRRIVSSPASGIAFSPTPLSSLADLPTPIPNPEARAIITNPLRTLATEMNQRQAVAIATTGGVYTSINGLRKSQHPSTWALTHDVSCVCNGQTPGGVHVEQTAVYECKRLGDSNLCNTTRFESISWSPTLPDNRDVLEHRYAAKQHLVHSMWGAHKGDLERGMLKQRPTLGITRSNWYQVRAQVNKVKSHFIQSAGDNIAELYDLHRFESATERLEFIYSLRADNKYRFPVAEPGEGGVRGPNPMQRESKAANEWPASTLLPGASNPAVYQHRILSLGE